MDNLNEKIIAKIKALLSKTLESGATESEALSALEKAKELMNKYNISERDIRETKEKSGIHKGEFDGGEILYYVSFLLSAIEKVSEAHIMMEGNKILYMGLEKDKLMAEYLLNICWRSMKYEVDKFSKTECALYTKDKKLRKIRSFLNGMATRLYQKIMDMEKIKDTNSTSKEIIVCKQNIYDEELRNMNIKLKNAKLSYSGNDMESKIKGSLAGDRTQFNLGVSNSTNGLVKQ